MYISLPLSLLLTPQASPTSPYRFIKSSTRAHHTFYILSKLNIKMMKGDATNIEIREVGESSMDRKGIAPLLSSAGKAQAGGYKKGMAIFDLILRIGAVAAALAATVVMATAEQTLPFFTQFFQFQAGYDDIPTFQFFVIAMAITTGYLVLSTPFSIVCIIRPLAIAPRLLLIICDTLTLTFATSAAAASAAIVYLAHNGNSSANWLAICQQFNDFCQATSGAVVASFVAVSLLIFLVIISALALRKQ